MSYRVRTRTTAPQYGGRTPEVIRRFSDFALLHDQLHRKFKGGCHTTRMCAAHVNRLGRLSCRRSDGVRMQRAHPRSSFCSASMAQIHATKLQQKVIQIWMSSKALQTACRCAAGIIMPPIPEKNVVQKYQASTEFIVQRQQALNVFINRVVRPPRGQRLSDRFSRRRCRSSASM